MSRSRAVMVGAVLVVGVVAPGAQPAQAHLNPCAVHGVLQTSAPVFFQGLGRAAHAEFFVVPNLSSCFAGGLVLSGHFIGWCDNSIGSGVAHDGYPHQFDYSGKGSSLTFLGPGVVGTAKIVPAVVAGQSCVTGATQFLFMAKLVLA